MTPDIASLAEQARLEAVQQLRARAEAQLLFAEELRLRVHALLVEHHLTMRAVDPE